MNRNTSMTNMNGCAQDSQIPATTDQLDMTGLHSWRELIKEFARNAEKKN